MKSEVRMGFMQHLVELRNRLIKSVGAVLILTVVAFFFWQDVLDLLSRPYLEATGGDRLRFFQVTEAFTLALRISLFTGLIAASPVLIYQLWRFVSPALTTREKRYIIPLSGVLGLLFTAGIVGGYLALPFSLELLVSFGNDLLEPTIGADFYLRFAMRFLLAFGLAFEFPVFLFAAAMFGLITSARLREFRRWALTIILIGAALLTPGGDPLTLALLATPLYVLYEGTILAIRYILRK